MFVYGHLCPAFWCPPRIRFRPSNSSPYTHLLLQTCLKVQMNADDTQLYLSFDLNVENDENDAREKIEMIMHQRYKTMDDCQHIETE